MSPPLLTGLVAWVKSPGYIDLTARQLAMLELLCVRAAPTRLGTVAHLLGLSKPVVSRASRRLAACGLVTRARGTVDRRDLFLSPTDAGRRLRDTIGGLA